MAEPAAAVAEAAAFVADVTAPVTAAMLSATVFTSSMFSATTTMLLEPRGEDGSTASVMEPRSVGKEAATPRSAATIAMSARAEAVTATAGYS